MNTPVKATAHKLRKNRVRAKVVGSSARPRLSVTISNLHVSAQLIDDTNGKTLAAASTVGAGQKGTITEKAKFVGTEIGKKAKAAKIKKIVFDRNGRLYAGRLKKTCLCRLTLISPSRVN